MNTLLDISSLPDMNIPDKFRDKETGKLRVDALLDSYRELEKRLSAAPQNNSAPAPDGNLLHLPETAETYRITISHDMFTEDDAINQRLREKGFTNEQAQFVYDLAAEKMVPLILDIAREYEAERQIDRLIAAFGSRERYLEIARQLLAYGQKHLAPDVLEGLASSYDGVMALYRMMQSGKPMTPQNGPAPDASLDETALRTMMRDPKYWRDKDPAFVKKVSDGFRQVFAEHA